MRSGHKVQCRRRQAHLLLERVALPVRDVLLDKGIQWGVGVENGGNLIWGSARGQNRQAWRLGPGLIQRFVQCHGQRIFWCIHYSCIRVRRMVGKKQVAEVEVIENKRCGKMFVLRGNIGIRNLQNSLYPIGYRDWRLNCKQKTPQVPPSVSVPNRIEIGTPRWWQL